MEANEPKSGLVAVVGVVSSVALVFVILLLQAFYYRSEEREKEQKAVAFPPEVQLVQAQQLGQLEGYRVIDGARGIVAIPIERAIELFVNEQQKGETE